jgi:hypothetical protein
MQLKKYQVPKTARLYFRHLGYSVVQNGGKKKKGGNSCPCLGGGHSSQGDSDLVFLGQLTTSDLIITVWGWGHRVEPVAWLQYHGGRWLETGPWESARCGIQGYISWKPSGPDFNIWWAGSSQFFPRGSCFLQDPIGFLSQEGPFLISLSPGTFIPGTFILG